MLLLICCIKSRGFDRCCPLVAICMHILVTCELHVMFSRHSSHVTLHTWPATRHTSHVTCHTVTLVYMSPDAQNAFVKATESDAFMMNTSRSNVTHHTSHFTCHTSHVTRHPPYVIRHTSHITHHTTQHLRMGVLRHMGRCSRQLPPKVAPQPYYFYRFSVLNRDTF